jgi:hypothetical protein
MAESSRFEGAGTDCCFAAQQDKVRTAPHNIVCGALRKFCSRISLHFLAIHKVLLRQCAPFGRKIYPQIALAELCGAAFDKDLLTEPTTKMFFKKMISLVHNKRAACYDAYRKK